MGLESSWIPYALITSIAMTTGMIVYKYQYHPRVTSSRPFLFACWLAFFYGLLSCVVLLSYHFFYHPISFPPPQVHLIVIIAILCMFANLCYWKSISLARHISVFRAMLAFEVFILFGFSWYVYREVPSILERIGLVLIGLGMLFLAYSNYL